MSGSQPDIDRLVREVLAELGVAPAAATTQSAVPGLSAGAEGRGAKGEGRGTRDDGREGRDQPPIAIADGEFTATCRVVTMAEVAGRLATMRRLVVPAQAVVTPAVRDELRRRDICLVYAAPPPEGCTLRLCVVTVGRRFDPAPLAAALAGQGVEVQTSAWDCLLVATDRLAAEVVRGGTLGLLLTGHTAAALCLANRHRGVRAVWGGDAAAAAAAVAAVGANLLVIDPAAGSSYQLKQIAAEFCGGGTRRCPEAFRERLG